MQGISGESIGRIVQELCELNSHAYNDYDTDISVKVDTTDLRGNEMRELKTDLNDSVGKLADQVVETVAGALRSKSTFDFPPSLDTLIGQVLTQNSIRMNDAEMKLQVVNILDRIFKLPIDQDMNNLQHPRSKSYRNTAQINPDLSTLVKALVIAPVLDAARDHNTEGPIDDGFSANAASDDNYWLDFAFDAEKDTEVSPYDENQTGLNDALNQEYYNVIHSMPEISVPHLFNRLEHAQDEDSQLYIMEILSTIKLPYDAKREKLLLKIIADQYNKTPPGDTGINDEQSDIIFLALSILSQFEHLNYNRSLERLIVEMLQEYDDKDLEFCAARVISKMNYDQHSIDDAVKTHLLESMISEDEYSDQTFYASAALAHNIRSITVDDLTELLDAVDKTASSKLTAALVIKIGQTREDLKPIIIDRLWTKVTQPLPDYIDCFEILQALSEDRTRTDAFIKGTPLDEHLVETLTLALGLHEGLTQKYNLERDDTIDEFKSLAFKLPDEGGFASQDPTYNIEQETRFHKLTGDYNALIEDLVFQDERLRKIIAEYLQAHMHKPSVIKRLKDVAISSNDEKLKKIIIDLMEFTVMSFDRCLEFDAHDVIPMSSEDEDSDSPRRPNNNGSGTSTKLLLGDPSEEIKTLALDAIFQIALKSHSVEIQKHATRPFVFLGAEAYKQIADITNRDSTLKTPEAQLAEQIMFDSRYLRSRNYPVTA